MTGIFCELCEKPAEGEERVFYVKATQDTFARCQTCGSTLGTTAGIAMAVLAALLLLCLGYKWVQLKLSVWPTLKRRLEYFWHVFAPHVKLKATMGLELTQ